jgi:hypothetical protein
MDCSKTIDFFAEAKRLCDSRTGCTADVANKEQCPLFAFCKHPGITRGAEYAKKLIENLQKWSNEHPKKTYAQDFFEKFPKARRNSDGTPFVCRERIYGGECPVLECDECWNKDCWNEPMNDEETKGA